MNKNMTDINPPSILEFCDLLGIKLTDEEKYLLGYSLKKRNIQNDDAPMRRTLLYLKYMTGNEE